MRSLPSSRRSASSAASNLLRSAAVVSHAAQCSAARSARLLMRRTSNCGAALAGAARAGGSSSSSSRRGLPPPALDERLRQRGTLRARLLRAPLPPPLPPLAYWRTAAQASRCASGSCGADQASGASARNTRSEALRAREARSAVHEADAVLPTRRACSARGPRERGLQAATSLPPAELKCTRHARDDGISASELDTATRNASGRRDDMSGARRPKTERTKRQHVCNGTQGVRCYTSGSGHGSIFGGAWLVCKAQGRGGDAGK